MPRTSLILPATLRQRLHTEATYSSLKVAELIRELLDKALQVREQARLNHTYKALKKVHGVCTENVTDASTNINQTLYGDEGAWKGQNAE